MGEGGGQVTGKTTPYAPVLGGRVTALASEAPSMRTNRSIASFFSDFMRAPPYSPNPKTKKMMAAMITIKGRKSIRNRFRAFLLSTGRSPMNFPV